jgi:hypothetical protein
MWLMAQAVRTDSGIADGERWSNEQNQTHQQRRYVQHPAK